MLKRSVLVIFVIIFFASLLMAIPDNTPISIFIDDVVNMANATSSWAVELYDINLTGIGQTICIIDTGINFSHPDLLGKNLTCNIDCFNKACVEDCSVSDDEGHGTHVAGIAAANGTKKGIARDANLIGVKALDSNGNGQLSYMVNGIIWCTDNAATYNITTISMSLGTDAPFLYNSYCDSESTSTATAINNAVAKNISVIAATGNNGNTTHISIPACMQNATSVSATDDDDSIASYANYNSITNLFAPGTSVSSLNYLTTGYTTKSGTSMSTPAVAGAFALINQLYLLQKNRPAPPIFIQNILTLKGKTIEQDFKRIDILSSIIEMSKPNVTLISPTNDTETFTETNFTCNASSPSNYTIQNLTFYLWNSTGLVYQETKNSGTNNNATFNYSLPINFYEWNCLVFDNKSYQSFASSNNTINFTETQSITLLSPARNAIITNTNNATFNFNTSINASNCSLIFNGEINETTLNITNYSFSKTLSNGNYNWSINCTTNESIINSSSTRTLAMNYDPVIIQETPTDGGSSSGGGGTYSGTKYRIEENELQQGITKKLREKDIVRMNVREKEHSITIKSIEKTKIEILIESSPQNITLTLGETKKVSLEDNYNNLKITLNSIISSKANISIKEILEIIDLPIKALSDTKNETSEINNAPETDETKQIKKYWNIYVALGIFILIILIMIVITHFLIEEYKDKE